MRRTAVLDVVGLSGSLLGGPHTPHLNELLAGRASIQPVFPAVTCPAQSTYLTGKPPRDHGIVGNGWYFRDLSEIWFWRQSNRLVQGEKIWHAGRRRHPDFTCANLFWWYNMVTDADWSVTPRPVYLADGRKIPDCYASPPGLRAELTRQLGRFPLFRFWGPFTAIDSSRWIAQAAMALEELHRPVLSLVYLPHLDYCLQREGPEGAIAADLAAVDTLCGELLAFYRGRGVRVVVLSEYGIAPVRRPVHPNRHLRRRGYLAVKEDLGREYLDPGDSRAFAVADHQVAHVYLGDPGDVDAVRGELGDLPGVQEVLDAEGKRRCGIDHERAGELVLVAEPDSWFTYYFWEDDKKAPDYARTVDIHRKPGYDPCELFVAPAIRQPRLRLLSFLLRQRLGFRTLLELTPLDAGLVRGSHGLAGGDPDHGPLLMTTEPGLLERDQLRAEEVFDLLLRHVFES